MSLPKVAYVVKRYPRYSETFIVNELLAHEEAGWELEIFALNPPVDTHFQDAIARVRAPVSYLRVPSHKADALWQNLREAGRDLPGFWQRLEHLERQDLHSIWQAVTLARAVRERNITHLHAHFATSATTITRLAAQLAGVPYSFTAHAKDIFHETVEPEDLSAKLQDAAAVVTVSEYNCAYLKTTYGNAAHTVRRIYNGLDLARFPFEIPRQRLPLIVAVGRLVEKKGFTVLIQACALLAERGVSFRCEILGTGELEASLRHQLNALGLQGKVELLGPRPQQEVIQHVERARVFAAPCVVADDGNRDGLPTVLLEAMALGTPCISTDVTGIPEVIRHEETGLQVPQHDVQALAAALERLLTHEALCTEMATRARALIETSFDIRRNAAQLRELFVTAASDFQTKAKALV